MVGGRVLSSVPDPGEPVARVKESSIEQSGVMTTTPHALTDAWPALLVAWTAYLRAAGRPDTTIGLRRYHMMRLAKVFPDGPTSVGFEAMVGWLGEQDWKPNTRRSYRASLRVFWQWLVATGRTEQSPAHLLPSVAVPRARPRPTPETAFRDALAKADDRARLGILLAGKCGLRRGELARAHTKDLVEDLVGWSLRVVGKGGHVRMVPLPDDLAGEIRRRAPGWLFPSKVDPAQPLTPHHLGKEISKYLPSGMTTHSLRHRCATVAYAGSRDVFAVQELLGHAKTETTKIYVEIAADAVRRAMLAAAS